jgi:lysophospholipase L1-like esterase
VKILKKIPLLIIFSFALLVINSCSIFTSDGYIDADDPLIIYEGRFDFSDPKNPRFDWPGSSIHAVFEGKSVSIRLTDGNNDYNVFIDNKLKKIIRTDSSIVYNISDSLSPGKHRISLTKRTEGSFGIASFQGFILSEGKTLHPLGQIYKRKMEFIGDSFVAGFGSEGKSPDCDFSRDTENNYIAYGPVLARKLKAYVTIIAISGIGMVRNHSDSTRTSLISMSNLYNRTCLNDTLEWNFSKYQPEVVVIRLGRNDYWNKPFPRRDDFRTAYLNFLKNVRTNYPKAHIFALCGPIRREPHCDYIKSVVNELNDKKIYFVKLDINLKRPDDFGCQYHPNNQGHEKIAAFLEPIIRAKTGWK